MLITIDGGSASGKSTLAKEFSLRFEIPLLESGSLYRTLTIKAIQAGLDFSNEQELIRFVKSKSLNMKLVARRWYLEVDGNIPSKDDLRSLEVTEKVSLLAQVGAIRNLLHPLQRSCYHKKHHPYLVAEGRDMGSVIFPRADSKIFLKVSSQDQASRRQKDFEKMGVELSAEEVSRREAERDQRDASRKASPLKSA